MNRMKQITLAALACITLLALLAGCNKSSAGGQQTGAVTGEKINLLWWQDTSGPAEVFIPAADALIKKYNDTNDKNINVTTEYIGDNYYEMMLTAVSSGNAPDAAVGWTAQPMQYGLIGEGLALNSIYDEWVAEKNPIISDINKEYWDFYTAPDNTLYGIPFRYDPRVITYRKDMFEQAGITKLPTTWDEFLDTCRVLKKAFPDKIPFIVGAGGFLGIHVIIGFGVNNDTGFFTPDMKPNMTSKEWIEMLEFFGTMRAEGLISEGSASYTWPDTQMMFAQGEGAMVYQGIPNFIKGTPYENICGIMPPLKGPSGTRQQTYAWVNGSHGLNQTEHPEEAKAWLKWFSENTLTLFTDGQVGSQPMLKSQEAAPQIASDWMRRETFAATAYGCVTNVFPVPYCYLEFSQIEGEGIPAEALRRVMQGGTNYAEIAAEWNARLAAIFN